MTSSTLRTSCPFISLDEIRHEDGSIPFQFDKGKVLGKGGEAIVYLGSLNTGQKKTLVAVKRLIYNSINEFKSEIETMSKIHHSNTVSLLGYCDQSDMKILIYEYMEKGSLANYIMPKDGGIVLSWKQRLNICLGAARGLQYLHTKTPEFSKGIIHRDIKPDNILIDENWVGKIADFGMVKLSEADQAKSTMRTNIKGTAGFFAPEYLSYGVVSRKIDVYAFGVVLFNVLCLKSPWIRAESYCRSEEEDLGHYAKQHIDTKIKEEISADSLIVYTDIIQGSLQLDPIKRPNMGTVVLNLEMALKCQNLQDEAKGGTRSERNFIPEIVSGVEKHLPKDIDASETKHLHTLLGKEQRFYPGSKILVTTRNRSLVKDFTVDTQVQKIVGLNDDDSLELFSWHAFQQCHPQEEYKQLSKEILLRCEGLPLALEVLGSSLRKTMDIVFWQMQLRKWDEITNPSIQEVMQISYDSLEDGTVKNLFLHVACFFVGAEEDYVVTMLEDCSAFVGITNLIDRCLIKRIGKSLMMHQVIQDMGREIVRQESPYEPGHRSRLWHHEDSFAVLKYDLGTEKVQGVLEYSRD